jgi:hypothetical protein
VLLQGEAGTPKAVVLIGFKERKIHPGIGTGELLVILVIAIGVAVAVALASRKK